MKKTGWLAIGILSASLLAGCSRPASSPTTATAQPCDIRMVDTVRDAPTLERIEVLRQKLPEKYRRRNNFAWAFAEIEGLEKQEYFSHSGIKSLKDLSSIPAAQVEGISLRRRNGRFKVLCVNHDDVVEGPDCWPRNVDTEYKILEDMADHLPDPAAAGHVLLYTDLYPCASCRNVMAQFLAIYTNVQMQVLFRER